MLGIDGGATSSTAAWLGRDGNLLGQARGDSCNVVLKNPTEILAIFQRLQRCRPKDLPGTLQAVALCLAGVIDDFQRRRVLRIARKVWKRIPIWISDDLISALYSGLGHGEGIVVISGTGSSVYGRSNDQEARAGGWGHVLGDAGSAYYIAHRALRWEISNYDATDTIDTLGKLLLKRAQLKTIEELTTFVSRADKKSLANLSEAVFKAAHGGHRGAQGVLVGAAKALARNTAIVSRRLGKDRLPICVSGGVFQSQDSFLKLYKNALKEHLPHARPRRAPESAALGAALWGWEQIGHRLSPSPRLAMKKKESTLSRRSSIQLKEIEEHIRLEELPTENPNPRSINLSSLDLLDALRLFINEDRKYLFSSVESEISKIGKAVDLVAHALERGGRLFYVGAGTSGRLGILDASECPPTFRTHPDQVQGIIAGGFEALLSPVEHAEDRFEDGQRALRLKGLSAKDIVCGISASGRTPFVMGALAEAEKRKAQRIFIRCHSQQSSLRDLPQNTLVISVDTGPEVLTGSTRLRAGTATKIVLNLISTMTMVQLGKVYQNHMIDLQPTNYKLMARAINILQTINGLSKEEAFEELQKSSWNLKNALRLKKVSS